MDVTTVTLDPTKPNDPTIAAVRYDMVCATKGAFWNRFASEARRIAVNIAKLAWNSGHATCSAGKSEGSSLRISLSGSVSVSAGKETTDEKQTQHFGQCQT